MKTTLITAYFLLFLVPVSRLFGQAPVAPEVAPADTQEQQLLQIIKLHENGTLHSDSFTYEIRARASIWNAKTILFLNSQGVSESEITEVEKVLNQRVAHQAPARKTIILHRPAPPSETQQKADQAKDIAIRARDIAAAASKSATDLRASGAPETEAGANELRLARQLAEQAQINAQQAAINAEQAQNNAHELDATNATLSSLFHHMAISTGAKFLSPYEIKVTNNAATLSKTGNSTVGYLEFSAFNRFVLNLSPDAEDRDPAKKQGPQIGFTAADEIQAPEGPQSPWLAPWAHVPDWEAHIGFVFSGTSGSSNFSATTIAGGSDFYANAAIGWPFWRYTSTNDHTAMQLTLETAGGANTEKSFLAVHPNAFVGPGFQWRFLAHDNSFGFLCARAGYGWIDIPRFTSASDTDIVVVGGLPKFDLKGSPSLGVFFAYPLGNVFLNVGADVYFRDNPAPWSITVGTTIPVENILTTFGIGGSKK